MRTNWTPSDISNPVAISERRPEWQDDIVEWEDDRGDWHSFHLIATADRIVFGGVCNAGFLESGYIRRLDGEATGRTLEAMLDELQAYYNEGPELFGQYDNRIVFNQRM